ncbi:N-6 DNA methylase [Flavonifractor sp. An92]|uniref:HsdM family class I SAM-dependent methyltransferase n=1 Tax=Flavonifractor sp. An92 TaxID=1965666 RepID=UPI001179EABF|nr:N-6 DNA methylase [Flavonifractor sp. An92]
MQNFIELGILCYGDQMTAEIILKHIPSKYSNLQIEASLILAFLRQNQLDCINHSQFLDDILCHAESEVCEIITRVSAGNLSLKLLENVFEALVDDCEKRENGVVFTPCYIVEYILENTLNEQLAEDSVIIDPACGSGAFLVLAAEKLTLRLNKSVAETVSQNIFGIDLSEDNVRRTKELLTLLVLSYGESADSLCFNIKVADSLKENWFELFGKKTFHFVIGNPPYVNTHDMSKDTISYLKKNYRTTQKGTFNIFYAFIEQSMKFLSPNGMLGFIIPNNYLTITAAEDLRKYLVENKYLSKIIDFGENMIFAPVRTYNSLLFLKACGSENLMYATIKKSSDVKGALNNANFLCMAIDDLDSSGWKLLDENERANIKKIEQAGSPIKPYIRVGIATLRDNVYLVDGFDQEKGMYYKLFEGTRYLIEPEITRSIYKVSNIKAESSLADAKQAIIFPYTEIEQYSLVDTPNKNYQIIPEHIMAQRYPQCYQYLCRCRTILDTRDKGKGNAVAWYAYGRSQGLGNNSRKLLFPTFSLHPKFMLEESRQTLFCNGYAILESPQFDLEILQKILNSVVMDYYVSKTSYAIEGNYKCYQKKYIQRFSVPQFTDDELTYLKNEPNMSSINQFLIEKYGLSDFRI